MTNIVLQTNFGGISNESLLKKYIREINKFPILSQEEEFLLTKEYSIKKSLDAANKLVTSHLRLVVKIAMEFKDYGLPIMDIISEGNLGLMNAVKKFDHNHGCRLSTYAMWWIKANIQEYIIKTWSLVKIGSEAMRKKILFGMEYVKNKISFLDNNIPMVKESSIEDENLVMSDDSNNQLDYVIGVENDEHRQVIADEVLSSLKDRERDIFVARKSHLATLSDLSKKYDISIERVRQIENKVQLHVNDMVQKIQDCS